MIFVEAFQDPCSNSHTNTKNIYNMYICFVYDYRNIFFERPYTKFKICNCFIKFSYKYAIISPLRKLLLWLFYSYFVNLIYLLYAGALQISVHPSPSRLASSTFSCLLHPDSSSTWLRSLLNWVCHLNLDLPSCLLPIDIPISVSLCMKTLYMFFFNMFVFKNHLLYFI